MSLQYVLNQFNPPETNSFPSNKSSWIGSWKQYITFSITIDKVLAIKKLNGTQTFHEILRLDICLSEVAQDSQRKRILTKSS